MDVAVGNWIDFRKNVGRGRPSLGKVVQNAGIGYKVFSPVRQKVEFVSKNKIVRVREDKPAWIDALNAENRVPRKPKAA